MDPVANALLEIGQKTAAVAALLPKTLAFLSIANWSLSLHGAWYPAAGGQGAARDQDTRLMKGVPLVRRAEQSRRGK